MQITLIVIAILLFCLCVCVSALTAASFLNWRTQNKTHQYLLAFSNSLAHNATIATGNYETTTSLKGLIEAFGKTMAKQLEVIEENSKHHAGQFRLLEELLKATLSLESAVTAFTRLNFGVDSGKPANTMDRMAQEEQVDNLIQSQGLSRQEATETLRRDRAYGNFSY